MEEERVREEIAKIILATYHAGSIGAGSSGVSISDVSEIGVNQILAIKGIRIEAENQDLPDNTFWHKEEREFEAYCAGHNDMLQAGFVRVLPKKE